MIVLDTDVVSELMRPSPSPDVRAWVRSRPARERHTTAITLAEIRHGIARLPEGARKELLAAAADRVFSVFAEQVLAFDAPAAAHYAQLVAARERAGSPIEAFDAQIAAVCRARGAELATRNGRDFVGTGVRVVDPWQDR